MGAELASLENFARQVEQTFGKTLTAPARQAVEDFWNHQQLFMEAITNHQLSIRVNPSRLANRLPQYRRYNTWKIGGIWSIIVGLAYIFFEPPIGIVIFVGGFLMRAYGNRVRSKGAEAYSRDIMDEARLRPYNGGYARICTNYIAGIIKLATTQESVFWPRCPSDAITGDKTYVDPKAGETLGLAWGAPWGLPHY
jgi:hypothetical protein